MSLFNKNKKGNNANGASDSDQLQDFIDLTKTNVIIPPIHDV